MSHLRLALFLALVLSCLAMIQVSYEARRLFVEVERAQKEERTLETEYARLQVEKRAEATPLRVESLARERLQMRPATPGVTHYVNLQGARYPAAEPPLVDSAELPPAGAGEAGAARGVAR